MRWEEVDEIVGRKPRYIRRFEPRWSDRTHWHTSGAGEPSRAGQASERRRCRDLSVVIADGKHQPAELMGIAHRSVFLE